MKRLVAQFLAAYLFFGSLFPGNSFFEFSEVPTLIKHFQYHRATETPGIGFIDFMVLHYANAEHEKSDPANHTKLPVHHGFTSSTTDQVAPSAVNLCTTCIKRNNYSNLLYNYQPAIPLNITEAVFHPPKV